MSAEEGVTCSQFITYTFQAAAIWQSVLAHAPVALVINNAFNNGMPDTLKINATRMSVDALTDRLRNHIGFQHVGNLAVDDD